MPHITKEERQKFKLFLKEAKHVQNILQTKAEQTGCLMDEMFMFGFCECLCTLARYCKISERSFYHTYSCDEDTSTK